MMIRQSTRGLLSSSMVSWVALSLSFVTSTPANGSVPKNQLTGENNFPYWTNICRVNDGGTGAVIHKRIHTDGSVTLCVLTADHVVNQEQTFVAFGNQGTLNTPKFRIARYYKPHETVDLLGRRGIWMGENLYHTPDIAVLIIFVPKTHRHIDFARSVSVLNLEVPTDRQGEQLLLNQDINIDRRPDFLVVGFGSTGNLETDFVVGDTTVTSGYLQELRSYGKQRYFFNKPFRIEQYAGIYTYANLDDIQSGKLYSHYELVYQLDAPSEHDFVEGEGMGMPGDSGSPVLVWRSYGYVIVGLHVRGTYAAYKDNNRNNQFDPEVDQLYKPIWRPPNNTRDGIGARGYAVGLAPQYIAWIRAASDSGCTITTFEEFFAPSTNGTVLFRQPSFSASTAQFLNTITNSSRVVEEEPNFTPGGRKSLKIAWRFLGSQPNAWLRLSTFNALLLPNPEINFLHQLRLRIYVPTGTPDFRIALGVRETGTTAGCAENAGVNGGIEWVGFSNLNGPPGGQLINKKDEWVDVLFDVVRGPYRAFAGMTANGQLDGLRGTFEHLAFTPVNPDDTSDYVVYIDDIETLIVDDVLLNEPGDANGDGCVDDQDLLLILFAFGSAGGMEDLNSDGVVDDSDLLLVLFNFGSGC